MNVIVPCLGQLNVPKVPQFDGMDRYQGEAFHSADWRKDYDATGRTVAVIGTGASAVQIVPTLAPKVCLEFFTTTQHYLFCGYYLVVRSHCPTPRQTQMLIN